MPVAEAGPFALLGMCQQASLGYTNEGFNWRLPDICLRPHSDKAVRMQLISNLGSLEAITCKLRQRCSRFWQCKCSVGVLTVIQTETLASCST